MSLLSLLRLVVELDENTEVDGPQKTFAMITYPPTTISILICKRVQRYRRRRSTVSWEWSGGTLVALINLCKWSYPQSIASTPMFMQTLVVGLLQTHPTFHIRAYWLDFISEVRTNVLTVKIVCVFIDSGLTIVIFVSFHDHCTHHFLYERLASRQRHTRAISKLSTHSSTISRHYLLFLNARTWSLF